MRFGKNQPVSNPLLILLLSAALSVCGQLLFYRKNLWGLAPYGLAVLLWLLALDAERLTPPALLRATAARSWYRTGWRIAALVIGLVAAALTFVWSSDNTFRWYGVLTWLLSVTATMVAFWRPSPAGWRQFGLSRAGLRLSWTTVTVIALLLLGFGFRFWQLDAIPPEMNSDHIEKLMDVDDVLSGERPIFFIRNTGREPWQFYWTAGLIRLFDLRTDFWALKLGAGIVSLLTLPGVYLLAKELYGRWVALWALLFASVVSWHILISRVSLRYPYNPAVTAWALFFLFRGLRHGRRNDFMLLGLALGVGLNGYTAFRVMPLAVLVCWVLAWLAAVIFNQVRPRQWPWQNALLTVLLALLVFMPLLRYSFDNPDSFWYRSFSRVNDSKQPYSENILVIFAKNLRNLALMFHWDGDEVPVAHWKIDGPVLDPILGALLILGLVTALWRGLRQRDVCSLLLIIAGLLLLLPSALSLAYPGENPSVVRTGGAIPVVMTLAALPVGLGLQRAWAHLGGWRRIWVGGVALLLALGVILVNRQRIFVDYKAQCVQYAINATEIADALEGFVDSGGSLDNAYIKGWPHWVDTRGVGIELGQVGWDHGFMEAGVFDEQVGQPRPRFYVLHPHDTFGLERLRQLFPGGWSGVYRSRYPNKDFVIFYVPRVQGAPNMP